MHILKHRKILNKKSIIILLVTFIWLAADELLEFVFPTYLESINKSYWEIGLLLSLASIAGIIIDFPMGASSDRASRRKLMVMGLIISVIASIMVFYFKGDLLLALAFMIWGIGFQMWKVPRDAYFAAITEKSRRAEYYGLDSEVKSLAQTIGPIIGGFVLLYLGFNGIVSVYSLALILAALLLLLFIKETNHRSMFSALSSSGKISALISELKEFKHFGFIGIFLLTFALLFTAWEGALIAFQPLFYGPDVLNIPPTWGGFLLAAFSLPGLLFSYVFGKLIDKSGKKIAFLAGLIVMGAALIAFSAASSITLIFAFALIISVGWVISLIALNALIVDLSYAQRKGEVAGIWNFFMDFGYIIGPLAGGLIAELFGVRHVFGITGAIFLVASLIFLPLLASRKLSKQGIKA